MNCLTFQPIPGGPFTGKVRQHDRAGIFDAKNPANPFKDWYFVYIPTAPEDIHWGASDVDYVDFLDLLPTDSRTIRHRGS